MAAVRCAAALGAVLCLIPLPALAQPPASAAPLLRQTYQASGGDAWRSLAGAEVSGDYVSGGLKGDFQQRIDLRRGRDVLTYDIGATRGAQGTLPAMSWWTDDKGLTTVQDGPEALADTATQSYLDRNGWFVPGAAPAEALGQRSESGRRFDLVQVHPSGGRALTLWIDSATHRLDRAVQLDASQRETTTFYSDYRLVHGVWWPFGERVSSGDPAGDTVMTVRRLDFGAQPESAFRPPPSIVRDARLLPGPTTVPFSLKGGLIVVDVSIDGRPPLPFLLDSGALNLVTPSAAKALGMAGAGDINVNGVGGKQMTSQLAHADSYRVGPAELTDQQFIVIDLPPEVTANGADPPIAGLIGYEFLRRFVVRIDYQQHTLTVAWPNDRTTPDGVGLPLHFDGRDSFVLARAGDAAGYFGIDTGDDGSITLFKAFYDAHAIPIELPGLGGMQEGVGGVSRTLETRIPSLALGAYQLDRPLADISFAEGGAFASTLLAGNLGSQVFRNFVLTFDYPHRALYLTKSPEFGAPMAYNRTGIHASLDDKGAVTIKSVRAGSPAAVAGLQAGDQLIAVDGHPTAGTAFSAVQTWFEAPAGHRLMIDIVRSGQPLRVPVTTQEALPLDGAMRVDHDPLGEAKPNS